MLLKRNPEPIMEQLLRGERKTLNIGVDPAVGKDYSMRQVVFITNEGMKTVEVAPGSRVLLKMTEHVHNEVVINIKQQLVTAWESGAMIVVPPYMDIIILPPDVQPTVEAADESTILQGGQ